MNSKNLQKKKKMLEAMMSFLPDQIINAKLSDKKIKPYEISNCVILYMDISGFTSMSELLAAMGKEGAEKLTTIINSFFRQLIRIIVSNKGDIYRFGGDAIIALFDGEEVKRAVIAADEAINFVNQFGSVEIAEKTSKIKVHIGIAKGNIFFKDLRTDFLVAGKLGNRVMKLVDIAKPGEIILNSEARKNVKGVDFKNVERDAWKYEKITDNKVLKKEVTEKLQAETIGSVEKNILKLKNYLPEWVNNRMKLRTSFGSRDGEHRKMSLLFIHFSDIPYEKEPLRSSKIVEKIYKNTKELFDSYGGWLSKIDIYIDSIRILGVFGFPRSYENDEQRAVLLARDLLNNRELKDINMRIGINYGYTFGTPVGSRLRREYTVMGDAVNLAARIAAKTENRSIFVTEAMYNKTADFFKYKQLRARSFKGKRKKIYLYKFIEEKKSSATVISKWLSESEKLIGRKNAISKFKEKMALVKKSKGQIIGLEAEAGIGKSRLVQEFEKELIANRYSVFNGNCISYGSALSYHPWLSILKDFFQITPDDSIEIRKNKIRETVKKVDPKLIDWLPVIGEVMGIKFRETSLTKFLDAKIRKQRFFDIVFDFLKYVAAKKPICIIIEDLHWIDTVSLELVNYIGRNLYDKKILFLFAFRPIKEKIEFMEKDFWTHILLKELSQNETVELVKNLLNIKAMPEKVRKLIVNRSQGNPFYVEEIVKSLIEQSFIVEEKTGWKFSGDISKLNIPDTVEGVILSRIDRLTMPERDIIQTASVIGREFDDFVIYGIYPNKEMLKSVLNNLKKLDLIKVEKTKKEKRYFFKHILTQEAAYNTISFSKKQEIHFSTGNFIEKELKERREEFLGLLSYHFYKANDYDKSLLYSVEAGERAKKVYANEEAIEFFTRAIDSYHELEKFEKRTKK